MAKRVEELEAEVAQLRAQAEGLQVGVIAHVSMRFVELAQAPFVPLADAPADSCDAPDFGTLTLTWQQRLSSSSGLAQVRPAMLFRRRGRV